VAELRQGAAGRAGLALAETLVRRAERRVPQEVVAVRVLARQAAAVGQEARAAATAARAELGAA